ncbi:MAG: hypothetical protein AB7F78_14705 [Hyphomicrobiaceae bacterium]
MAFGKRRIAPAAGSRSSGLLAEGLSTAQRLEALRDSMLAMLEVAGQLADAVRNDTGVAMPVVADEADATAGPFVLKGFHDNFIAVGPAGISHVMYGYGLPEGGGPIDPNAQFHLQQLTGQALALNLYCQHAERDEVLGVALQSPQVPDVIDSILVRSAFFTAYFDNMLTAETAVRQPSSRQIPAMRENLDRYLLMARDRMLAPFRAQHLLPFKDWPFVGVELPVAAHEGDYFLNAVYFPADHAGLLIDAAKELEGNALQAVA